MSAFVVSNKHLNTIISYAIEKEYFYGIDGSPEAMGEILFNENIRSVNYRYGDEIENNTYQFERVNVSEFTARGIIKLVKCLDYQSCECPDYEQTKAFKALRSLVWNLSSELPEEEGLPWAI